VPAIETMSFCPMSWAAVGPEGVGVWPGVGTGVAWGVAIGVGAGVTLAAAVGEGESVGSRVTPDVTDAAGEPVGAVEGPSAVSAGAADGVLEQPARSRTRRKAPDRFMVVRMRSSSSLNDGAAGPRVMPHAGPD